MSDRDIDAELEEARLLAAKAGEHRTPQFDGTTIVEENDSKWIAAELRALRLTIEAGDRTIEIREDAREQGRQEERARIVELVERQLFSEGDGLSHEEGAWNHTLTAVLTAIKESDE